MQRWEEVGGGVKPTEGGEGGRGGKAVGVGEVSERAVIRGRRSRSMVESTSRKHLIEAGVRGGSGEVIALSWC